MKTLANFYLPPMVRTVSEIINEVEYTFTEFTIPISAMNTEELNTLLGKQEQVATLNGELVGSDVNGNEVFVLQVKGFTVRNRISSTGNPTEIEAEYLNEAQVRALCAAGLDLIFAETASETAADWHTPQRETDNYFRLRLKGDSRIWQNGSAADYGWSDCFGLLKGAKGEPGTDGKTYYPYVAFATAADGTDFITDGTDWTKEHKYIAFLSSEKAEVTAEDFAGLWVKFILDAATDIIIADAGGYFNSGNVEDVLQELVGCFSLTAHPAVKRIIPAYKKVNVFLKFIMITFYFAIFNFLEVGNDHGFKYAFLPCNGPFKNTATM